MNTTRSANWSESSLSELSGIQGVCLDIDDTLSTQGKLTAPAYQALWELKAAGLWVVPITGRPAGWCDHIVRFWPVDAVIGENGAFTFFMQEGVRKRLDTPGAEPDATQRRMRLEQLGRAIQQQFPKARWASDQAYREHDLAIDICEDVPRWKPEDVEALLALCQNAGAHAKLSSIHVNAWFGDYDKWAGFQAWKNQGFPGLKGAEKPMAEGDSWLFIGDSPNDEPLFARFPLSVGVANLRQYLPRLKHAPRWVTTQESGQGFVEMAARLVTARAARAVRS